MQRQTAEQPERNAASPLKVEEISVVLPAFNEQENIERTAGRCVEYLAPRFSCFELVIVNDGSADNTGSIVDRLSRSDPRIRAVHHQGNRGYGAALRSGFDAAVMRFVFYMDSDGQFDIRDLDRLLPLVTDDDNIVTGFRIKRQDPFLRRLNARLFGGWLVRAMLGVRVRDLNCAFKLIPRKVLRAVTLESTGALINAELFGRITRKGFGIKEVGVEHHPREAGVQTGAHPLVIFRAFYDLFRLRRKIVTGG